MLDLYEIAGEIRHHKCRECHLPTNGYEGPRSEHGEIRFCFWTLVSWIDQGLWRLSILFKVAQQCFPSSLKITAHSLVCWRHAEPQVRCLCGRWGWPKWFNKRVNMQTHLWWKISGRNLILANEKLAFSSSVFRRPYMFQLEFFHYAPLIVVHRIIIQWKEKKRTRDSKRSSAKH